MMKIWLNLLTRNQSQGFTLLELLIASVMSFFVISATGFAILIMTRQSLVTNVSSDLSFNTNRASDFISDEVKQSNFISTTSGVSGCTLGTGEQLIFSLGVASSNPNVVYYTKTPPGSVWMGPSSIYRCGPSLQGDGTLDASNIRSDILLDSVSTDTDATTNPSCPSGTTKSPSTPTAGFFLCVNNANSNLVQIRITTTSDRLDDDGLGRQSSGASSGNYTVTTNVFTRTSSSSATLTQSSGAGTCSGLTVEVDGRTAVNFSNGMTLVAERTSSIVFNPSLPTKTTPTANQDSYTNGTCTIIASF